MTVRSRPYRGGGGAFKGSVVSSNKSELIECFPAREVFKARHPPPPPPVPWSFLD